jgi:hypothetical protein
MMAPQISHLPRTSFAMNEAHEGFTNAEATSITLFGRLFLRLISWL